LENAVILIYSEEKEMKQIYVFCPYGLITGGPDALHQLVYYINKKKSIAHIVYTDITKRNKPIPKPYQVYVKDYLLLSDVVDDEENIIIVPETRSFYLKKYHKAGLYVWWLSVNNNTNTGFIDKIKKAFGKILSKNSIKKVFSFYYTPLRIKEFLKNKAYDFTNENPAITHLCASDYALSYVLSKTKNKVLSFVEPISLFFLKKGEYLGGEREKVILYNPKKNPKFYKKLLKNKEELIFKPLIGYKQEELLSLYRSSVLYIDFGSFPGQERIPKEAVLNGCLILTGKEGASFYHKDVPIPEEDKIQAINENFDLIYARIRYLLNNYDKEIVSFSEYRNMVKTTEDKFSESIDEILFGDKN